MRTHNLKCHPEYFKCIITGEKKFEVRKNDRDFQPGDLLNLQEYDPADGFTGREILTKTNYILFGGKFGIELGHVVMTIDIIKNSLYYRSDFDIFGKKIR